MRAIASNKLLPAAANKFVRLSVPYKPLAAIQFEFVSDGSIMLSIIQHQNSEPHNGTDHQWYGAENAQSLLINKIYLFQSPLPPILIL